MNPVWARIVRRAGRLVLLVAALSIAALVSIQFEGIVARNLALDGQVRDARARIDALVAREGRERRTIARLQTPQGAIPEIHEELRLVAPGEELIEVRDPGGARPAAHWDQSQ